MLTRILQSALFGTAAFAAGSACAANLAGNGGFEQPPLAGGVMTYTVGQTFAPWTVEAGGVDQIHRTFWMAREGNHSLDLNGSDAGGIRQTVATQPGQRYELTFAYAGNPGCTPGTRALGVFWGGSFVHSVIFDATATTTTAMGWKIQTSLLLDATAASTELAFRTLSPTGGCGPALDRVELVPRLHPSRGLRLASVTAAGGATGNRISELDSGGSFISADGRYVAFGGQASDLVPDDVNGQNYDVFVRDVATGTTELISRKAGTTMSANDDSIEAVISPDGRWVAYLSSANDVATVGPSPAAPGVYNVYLHDRLTRATRLVSVDANGGATLDVRFAAHRISDDGRFITFRTGSPNVVALPTVPGTLQVYLRDMLTSTTTLVSHNVAGTASAAASSSGGFMSRDGRWIVFESQGDDVAPGDTNGKSDVFLHDRATGLNTLVSRTAGGTSGNDSSSAEAISDDGARVGFTSLATNLAPGDGNADYDVFAYDRTANAVDRINCDATCATAGNGSSFSLKLSGNGRFALFTSRASDLVAGDTNGVLDVFVRNLETGAVERITDGTGPGSVNALTAISPDGRWVGFQSSHALTADDAASGPRDFFLRDRSINATYLVTRGERGSSEGGDEAEFSADGRRVAFMSDSDTLSAEADANDDLDVFTAELPLFDLLFSNGYE